MTMPVARWLKTTEIKKIQDMGTSGRAMSVEFFRDPLRAVTYNPGVFYSPADGVVLYALQPVKPDQFLEIKGNSFTVQDLLCDENYKYNSLVIGIFMTALDVHVNRTPTDSFFVEERNTPNLFTKNSSMLLAESDVLHSKVKLDDLGYLFSNERKVSVLFSPVLKQRYYMVQIADKDIDCIINWGKGKYIDQGSRFGQIRWGSQVDLIIPITRKTKNMKILVKPLDHVEAGLDAVIHL